MAKLPTFEAKKASGGGGGIVQMTPQQRSMRKAFRKSTDIKASDIYQQAGDQALAGAIGNMGALANKIALQRDEADYERRSQKMRQDYVAKMQDLNHRGIDAQQEAEKFFADTKDLYGTGASARTIKKLEKDFNQLSLRTRIHATDVTSKASKAIIDNSNIEKRNFYANEINAGRMSREDAVAEMTSHRVKQEGVYYSKDAIQQHLRNDNSVFVQGELNNMISSAEDPRQIDAVIDYHNQNAGSFSPKDNEILRAKSKAKLSQIKDQIFAENKNYYNVALTRAEQTGETDPEFYNNLKYIPVEQANALVQDLDNSLALYDFKQDISGIDTSNITSALSSAQAVADRYKKSGGVTKNIFPEMDRYLANYEKSLGEIKEKSDEMLIKRVSSQYAKGRAESRMGDSVFQKNRLLDLVPEKMRSKISERFNKIDAEFKSDYAGATQRYGKFGEQLSAARDAFLGAETDIEREAALEHLSGLTKTWIATQDPSESRIITKQELDTQVYSKIRTGNPNGVMEAANYIRSVYGEFAPKVVFDITQRIGENDLPKGMGQPQLAALVASITPAMVGDTESVSKISRAVYAYSGMATKDKPDITIPSDVTKFVGNDPLYAHKLLAYKSLLSIPDDAGDLYSHEEAFSIAFQDQILINGNTARNSYISPSGIEEIVDESNLNYSIQKIQNVIQSNAHKLIPPGQLNALERAGTLFQVMLEPVDNGFIIGVVGDRAGGYLKNQSGERILIGWDDLNELANKISEAPSNSGNNFGLLTRPRLDSNKWVDEIRNISNFDKPKPGTEMVWLEISAFEHLLDEEQANIRDGLVKAFQEHEQNGIKK